MSRKTARETVMKYVYQMEINNDFSIDKLDSFLESEGLSDSDSSFIEKSIMGIIDHKDEIDELIEAHLQGWKMDRIPRVDLSILRVAINEMNNLKDIPDSVAINEAVDMAKKFSTDDSYKFVNGVLGTYYRSKGE